MEYDEFLQWVENAGALDRDGAERSALATLYILGQRVTRGQADELAARLPGELQAPLLQAPDVEAEPFGAEEFVRRVAVREGSSLPEAAVHARAVLATLRQTVGTMETLRSQLSSDYNQLLV